MKLKVIVSGKHNSMLCNCEILQIKLIFYLYFTKTLGFNVSYRRIRYRIPAAIIFEGNQVELMNLSKACWKEGRWHMCPAMGGAVTRNEATGCPHRWGFLSLEVLSQLGKIFSISQPSLAVQLMHPFFLILKSVSVRHKRQNMFCPHCVWEIFFFFNIQNSIFF